MLYIREDIPSKSLTKIKLDNKKMAHFWFLQPKIDPY